jgi:hypothetical protein
MRPNKLTTVTGLEFPVVLEWSHAWPELTEASGGALGSRTPTADMSAKLAQGFR